MDLLKKLLSTDIEVKKDVYIKRLDDWVTVRGLTTDEFKSINERCEYWIGKGVKRERHFETDQARFMIIATGLVEPNLNTNEVLQAKNVMEAWEVVPKLFLPGEIELLETAIAECTGYTDDEVSNDEVEEVKN